VPESSTVVYWLINNGIFVHSSLSIIDKNTDHVRINNLY